MVETSGNKSFKEFDIIKFAREVISEIENIRSYSQATDEKTAESFNLPTESRINAFFRLIGLPMFVSIENKTEIRQDKGVLKAGDRILSPGYDSRQGRDITNKIIKNSDMVGNIPVSNLLRIRENSLSQIRNEIGSTELNERMRKALIRPLAIAPNVPANDDFQTGKIRAGEVGKDENTKRTVFKKLKPLITSYIDGGIQPRAHERARPFMRETQRHLIDNQTALPKPFIEEVVRIRLLHSANAEKNKDKEKSQEFVNQIKATLGEELFQEVFGSDQFLKEINVLEEFILSKMLSAAYQLASRYIALERRLQKALQKDRYEISIKTSSSKQSPFGKRTVISTSLELREGETANIIKELNIAINKDEALLSLLPTSDTIFLEQPNRATTKNVIPISLLNSFTSLLTPDLEQNKKTLRRLQEQSKRDAQELENLRVELDMMTGEFSEISIPDVVSVIIGLFLISREDLLALLDTGVLTDMSNDPSLKDALADFGVSPASSDTLTAINNLEKQVDFFFTAINFWINRFREKNIMKVKDNRKKDNITRREPDKPRERYVSLAKIEEG